MSNDNNPTKSGPEKESLDSSRKGSNRKTGSKKRGDSKTRGRSNNAVQRGRLNRPNAYQRQKNDVGMPPDLDLSIQEEITGGNFKLRGRKTQVSINHLLEFQLPEIERQREHISNKKASSRHSNSDQHAHLHGDSFINANYKLFVNDRADYREQSNDPNKLVPEEKIIRVVVPKGQNCPICLSEEPIAPRMITCGHIFCMSCLINFFSIEGTIKNPETGYVKKKKYKECPLCGSIVRRERVKAVLFEDASIYKSHDKKPTPGSLTTLQLMCKPHGSVLALPVQLKLDPLQVGDFPPLTCKELEPYARIMKCDKEQSVRFFQEDAEAIETQNEIDKALYGGNNKYVKEALAEIDTQIATILSEEDYEDTTSMIKSMERLNIDLPSKYDDSTAYFFYQTFFQSSTKFFLSPMDVKILLTTFHNYSAFPETLHAMVENVYYGTIVTESFINRYKYIGHLPIGTEVALIDIDWRSVPSIPKEVYDQFAVELRQRRRKFNMKKQKEDKQKKIYEKMLEKEQAEFYRRENSNFPYQDDFEIVNSYNSIRSSPVVLDSLGPSETNLNEDETSNVSKKKSYKEKTIWGTSISVTPNDKIIKENQEFEEMLLKRMQQEDASSDTSRDEKTQGGSRNGKKGKKKGKIMLFSNNNHQFK